MSMEDNRADDLAEWELDASALRQVVTHEHPLGLNVPECTLSFVTLVHGRPQVFDLFLCSAACSDAVAQAVENGMQPSP